ncbi:MULTISPECIES: Imm1 family immunity protein [unclassified Streptomyces]|uniref:Imm1 family immunity protein n=1 Tax=unclassified Streptomyces TaxID=2593676 RepID=UPI003D912E1F
MLRGAAAVFKEEHSENPFLLDSADAVDLMIDALIAGYPSRNTAKLTSLDRMSLPSGDPDHEFLVGVNPDAQVGIVCFADVEASFVPGGVADKEEVTYMLLTYPRDFLESPEIPIDLVRQVTKEFVLSGGLRPACIEWQEEPY